MVHTDVRKIQYLFSELVTDLSLMSFDPKNCEHSPLPNHSQDSSRRLAEIKVMLGEALTIIPDGRSVFTPDLELALEFAKRKQGFVDAAFFEKLAVNEAGRISGVAFDYCKLENLERITELTGLESLNLRSNGLSDISPLKSLANLSKLDLTSNNVTDIKPLASLRGLRDLTLQDNPFADSWSLAEFAQLRALNLNGTKINALSPLGQLTDLGFLRIANNNLSEIRTLSRLNQLISLDIGRNRISDLTPLRDMSRLITLEINDNPITDFSQIAKLSQLKLLDMKGVQGIQFGFLGSLKDLVFLNLAGCGLTTLPADLLTPPLQSLKISGNEIRDITLLKKCTHLKVLALHKPRGGFTKESNKFLYDFAKSEGEIRY